ncbi:hypothetical protein A9179_01910 [Pseudomonas alcaligenes]|uniref:DUF924 domain-containing protein n=1 Tax=Aquipseudomonas alcaligenes TaxID=43263 RepID=A0ABR7RWC7_AQUAC|nr:DUF924 family protein [Pseudomonas alcaligenes]MBC9249022.1 hypothetical protein [Pseudomonas alcaligenes]
MPAWQPLLDWWFGTAASAAEVAAQRQALWFGYRAEQDEQARQRFAACCEQALAGELQAWAEQPQGWLALLLLLDQLPRMLHRGTAQAFSGDARARSLLSAGLARGFDRQLPAIRQVFVYLVLEHAEELAAQDQAVAAFTRLHEQAQPAERELFAGFLEFAQRHREVIARFGRFPHRNAQLGRATTPDEEAFLREPGSRF